MDRRDIIKAGRHRYRKFYKMAAVATAICVSVIAGSLIVGDSVRQSLKLRVLDRLQGIRSVVLAADGFLGIEAMKELSTGDDSKAVLLSEGFVSRGGRLLPVTIWGMDRLPDGSAIPEGKIAINQELARQLGDLSDPGIVLRLPDDGLIPSSSLFVTGRYSTSLRLDYLATLDASKGGNLSLKNGQVIPFNVFVSRRELCDLLGIGDKLNTIISPDVIPGERLSNLSAESLGIRMDGGVITSDRVFIKAGVVDKLTAECEEPDRLFSYLVNSISKAGPSAGSGTGIPYSFATALDSWKGLPVEGAVLSDYTAKRLGVRKGDEVEVAYWVADELKNLSEKTLSFPVQEIVPLADLASDGHLSADFPGLSDTPRCSDWESDLPIDMSRITDEDEDFWATWKSTPKILLPYDVMRQEWSDSWGDATGIRTASPPEVLGVLNANDFSISTLQPLDNAIENATGGVDFAGLFLALGCFILFAALLLMYSPLSEMLSLRKDELSLLESIGFPRKPISRILYGEALPAAGIGALAGIVMAILYAGVVIFLLGNVWSGATHTDGFVLHPRGMAIVTGTVAGLVLALGVIWLAVRKSLNPREKRSTKRQGKGTKAAAIACTAALVASIIFGLMTDFKVIIFILTGCLSLAAGLLWTSFLLSCGDPSGKDRPAFIKQSLRRSRGDALTGMTALALGVFITFSVGLNRQDFSDKRALEGSTGGFDLWCDLTIPLQHDISCPEGREAAGLGDLPENTFVMQCPVVSGDDASCLNLGKVSTPGLIGFRESDFLNSTFKIKNNIFSLGDDRSVIRRMTEGDAVYGLVDETVLTWGLATSLGDTLKYSGPGGKEIDVIIAGTLPNTVFQGSVLVPENILRANWEKRGSNVLLVRSEIQDAATILETALNEYGIRAVPCTGRLRIFNSVTDTYLTIFLILGAIGLILGVASLTIGVRKRLAGKKKEILLERSLGFSDRTIYRNLESENLPLPVAAVLLGFLSAVLSVITSFGTISPATWLVCILTTAICLFVIFFQIRRMARDIVKETVEYEDIDY
ncbi:MAG: ABC transporter permease [Bacteroidales bacterium]|nr:ABC transporter permease [Bacteroidales bacterium]